MAGVLGWACWPGLENDRTQRPQLCVEEPTAYPNRVPLIAKAPYELALEEAFKLGAEAMRTEMVARLMVDGAQAQAIKLLQAPLPKFSLPEKFSVG